MVILLMVLKTVAIVLVSGLIVSVTGVFLYTLPSWLRLSEDPYTPSAYPSTIDEAVAAANASGLRGWGLVAYAQLLASERFRYSRRNPWDIPSRAFQQGLGYCLQQARALHAIYDKRGVESWIVMGTCTFPEKTVHGRPEPPATGRRAWLQARVGDQVKDVCPGNPSNSPGRVHFTVESEVRPLGGAELSASQWSRQIDEFDVDGLADQLASVGGVGMGMGLRLGGAHSQPAPIWSKTPCLRTSA